MTSDALKTLFHPFESGMLPLPGKGSRVLFLGAQAGFRLPEGFAGELSAVQGFRPDFLALERQGCRVFAQAEGDAHDLALVLCGRHRGENEMRLAEAILRVKPYGLIVVAGDKTEGVASLRKRLENDEDQLAAMIARKKPAAPIVVVGGSTPRAERLYHPSKAAVPLDGHMSKHHGVVFWLRRTPEADAFAAAMKEWYGHWPLVDGRFHTAPGMFSHDRIDPASKLLAEALPADLSGKAADFCAGWGYLSAKLLIRCPKVLSIDLYEADFSSLDAARRNLADLGAVATRFFWRDLLVEPVEGRYDAIVMNPPFHRGRAAEPEIGQGLIAVAAKALANRGSLFMVANRSLPYEKVLAAAFSQHREIAGDNAFKVFAARR